MSAEEEKKKAEKREEQEYLSTLECAICKSGEDDENMLLCDGCDKGFHLHCLGLKKVPATEFWYCIQCKFEITHNEKVKKNIKKAQAEKKSNTMRARVRRPPPDVTREIATFVEKHLLPAVNAGGAKGWDMRLAIQKVIAAAKAAQDYKLKKEAQAVLARLETVGIEYFRIHPKGRGILCDRPEGFPPVTFVAEYLGQLYSAQQWFELQSAGKKANESGELPDFYNIVIERPKDDCGGYDALFVDAMHMGNFSSRMSHSCDPNCQAVVMSCSGRLTIAVYTLRHIKCGEELTFDYGAVTEDAKEFKAATCLCGMTKCRGSYLGLAPDRAFQQVFEKQHNFVERNRVLLDACSEPMAEADWRRLARHGFGLSALGDFRAVYAAWAAAHGCGEQIMPDLSAPAAQGFLRRYLGLGLPAAPEWLLKWASLTLEFVEQEREALPKLILQQGQKRGSNLKAYTELAAGIEAKGIADSRLQNMVVALDKIWHQAASHGPETLQRPPVELLTEAEVVAYLVSGPASVLRRCTAAAGPFLCTACHNAMQDTTGRARRGAGKDHGLGCLCLNELTGLAEEPAATAKAARALLQRAEKALRALADPHTPRHAAAADILHMYASTRRYFKFNAVAGEAATAPAAAPAAPAAPEPVAPNGHAAAKDV